MLKVTELTKVFGSKTAVDRVGFEVSKPAMIGVIGRSGAGKSTMLRMLNRLADATSGTVEFEGRDITSLRGADKRHWRSECAMIFQQFNLVPRMDVVSNVLHGTLNRRSTLATMFNLYPQSDIDRAIDILDRLGIAEQAEKRAEALSGGQQQRVAIARALIIRPDLILFDEAVSALDVSVRAQILDLLADLCAAYNLTYLFISHDLSVVRTVTDRVLVMQSGQIVEEGATADVFENPQHSYTKTLIAAAPVLPDITQSVT